MRSTIRISLLASLSGLAMATPAFAQDASADSADQPTIIVTGTRRTDRTVAESPTPIDVYSGEELTKQGIPNEIRGDGDTILVPRDQITTLRMSLAGSGLPDASAFKA